MSRRVAVLGAGVSGLTAAWNLARRAGGRGVVLVEAAERLGGWMRSERAPSGAMLELGPRSLRTAGRAGKVTLGLVSELGLSEEVLPVLPGHRGAARRLIHTDRWGLVDVPSGPSWLLRTKPPFSGPLLPTLLAEPFRRRRAALDTKEKGSAEEGEEDESVHAFVSRRLSEEVCGALEELADFLIDPMCRGIFAGDCRSLSLRSCFPLLHDYEKQSGSVLRGALFSKRDALPSNAPPLVHRAVKERWQIYALRSGMEALPQALHRALVEGGVEVARGQPCTGITFGSQSAKVEVGERVYEVDHIVSALPSQILASLLLPSHAALSDQLASIPSVSVGVVCLEYEGHPLPAEYREAFGYLVPSHQSSKVLGVVFDSATFPQLDRPDQPSTRLTVMLGGAWFEELFGPVGEAQTSVVTEVALRTLQEHLGISQSPSFLRAEIHKNCIPQYTLGHASRVASIQSYVSQHALPLSLVGSSYAGVSINDCIHGAIQMTDTL